MSLQAAFLIYNASDIRRTLASDTPGVGRVLLCNCLAQIHQDIIACGNVSDDEMVKYICGTMRNTLTLLSVRYSAVLSSSN
jgi:hypothetical protein